MSCRERVDDGQCCSCHLSTPCSFCCDMSEEEVDAYANGGLSGLYELFKKQDLESVDKEDSL